MRGLGDGGDVTLDVVVLAGTQAPDVEHHVHLNSALSDGIDRLGNLIYVVADYQTVISLAQILQHAGAVDAMEFDINPEWHTLITYTHHDGLHPTMVEPQPMQSPDRYLVPDDRDFFAVYRRLPGPISVPFS